MSHNSFNGNQIWCPLCQEHKKFFRVQNAATLIDVSRRTIYRYFEEGKIFSIETPGGTKRVCGGCLMESESEDSSGKFSRQ